MSVQRLSRLQWYGFLAGGIIWFAEFVAGVGESTARCNPVGSVWGLPHDAIELGLMLFGVAVVGSALAASAIVFRETRNVDDQGPPPQGRIHFFAAAALAGNLVFLVIILLTGFGTIIDQACRQA